MNLKSPISLIYGIGDKIQKRLKSLKIETIEDLIFYYPFRFEDYSKIVKISELKPDEPATIEAKIKIIASKKSFKRKIVIECLVEDESGSIQIIWFNQPFLKKTLKVNDKVFFSGIPTLKYDTLQFVSPIFEKSTAKKNVHTGRIIPIYPLTSGVTQKQIRYYINAALNFKDAIKDFLPGKLIEKYQLLDLKQTISQIHYPQNLSDLNKAIDRLKFDEFFLIQYISQQIRKELHRNKACPIKFKEQQTKDFVKNLGFELTNAQRKSSWQILQDLKKEIPANRLLEGDVGSGKTAVAAICCLNVCLNDKQTVIMAPTEILAIQHFSGFLKYFKNYDFKIAVLTRTKKEIYLKGELVEKNKNKVFEKIASGEVKLILGTQALIQEKLSFFNLALAVIDEQHRFGVKQRQIITEKNKSDFYPHFLSMTATPIPRSLALALYGDLDISILDEMPKNRKKIISRLVRDADRQKAYDFIAEKISQGRQAFFICPLIDESDKMGFKAVTTEYEKISQRIFPQFKCEMLHGKLKALEKERIMSDFKNKKFDLLVSTSVIEVGIDVPNASVMVIEGADRFGLAQMHQFRGRVGRGEHQSYCLVFTDSTKPPVLDRLRDFVNCDNGFDLAQKDLQRRGPGEVYGKRQSGMPELKIAKLTDYKILDNAKNAAGDIFGEFFADEVIEKIEQKIEQSNLVYHLE